MTDFTPTPEAVEAVQEAINTRFTLSAKTKAAIATFVEAEGLMVEYTWINAVAHVDNATHQRLIGPWRKRD